MKTPHKHAELIKAWADGAEIEFYDQRFNEHRWKPASNPYWDENVDFRIKPEPKPDQVVFPVTAMYRGENGYAKTVSTFNQLKLTFDSETGKLKAAEVL